MARLFKIIICCSLLWLSACSSTTFVYNRLDFILPWYLDDYVDLTRAQKTQLDRALQPFLSWHRSEELPRYLDTIERIEAGLDQPLSQGDVAQFYGGFEQAWLRLQDEALTWLLDLGESLSAEQVAGFMAHLWERQEEFEQEYLPRSDVEYREESYDSFLDSMQDYLGRLDRAQRKRLRGAIDDLQRFDSSWLKERAAWLEQLEAILAREPGWQQRLRAAIDQQESTVSPDYRETYEHNLGVIFNAMAEVLNSRTDKQERRLRAELGDLREDLQTLVDQGVKADAA